MYRHKQTCVGAAIVIALIVGPVAFALHLQAQARNFRVVRQGVLYRSGQMTPSGLRRTFFDYGIKTVICLRDGTRPEDQEEEAFCNSEEINYVRIPPNAWGDLFGAPPAEEGVRKFRDVMSNPSNYPVLLHCLAGIHRTGIFTAIYRMEFEHWTNAQAMDELCACGYIELEDHLDVLGYLENYRPAWQLVAEPPASRPTARRSVTGKAATKKSSPMGPCGTQQRRPISAMPQTKCFAASQRQARLTADSAPASGR
jgi:tyrosine-protein phosphatase SIW14